MGGRLIHGFDLYTASTYTRQIQGNYYLNKRHKRVLKYLLVTLGSIIINACVKVRSKVGIWSLFLSSCVA